MDFKIFHYQSLNICRRNPDFVDQRWLSCDSDSHGHPGDRARVQGPRHRVDGRARQHSHHRDRQGRGPRAVQVLGGGEGGQTWDQTPSQDQRSVRSHDGLTRLAESRIFSCKHQLQYSLTFSCLSVPPFCDTFVCQHKSHSKCQH